MTPENPFSEYRDEFGQVGPLPATDGQRMAPGEGFFTGPDVGRQARARPMGRRARR